jgi:hypothetical protein
MMPATTPYGLTYTVEAALSAATGSYGAWDSGLWGTATWGPDIIWTDVSQYVRTITTQRRFDRDLQAWTAGSASVTLLNQDGRFNPNNLSGPYVSAGVTMVRPWRPMRIRFTWNGTTYDAYRGYVVSWPESIEEASPNAGVSTVTMVCTDEFGSLARFNGVTQALSGGGETTGARIHRILNAAGHTGTRAIDDGVMTCQPTDLGFNTVDGLKLTADSEGGAAWVDADGTVLFDGVFALIEKTRSNTVQAVFGDFPGDLPVADIGQEYNGDLLVNIVAWNRTNGAVQTSADATSRALYGDKQDSTKGNLVCEVDTQVKTLTDLWLQRYKDPEYRFTNITVKPRTDPSLMFPQVLERKIRDLIRVRRQPPGGITVTQDVFIAGVSHTVTADDFVTTFDLWSGKPYTTTPFVAAARWDTGKWDAAAWFY